MNNWRSKSLCEVGRCIILDTAEQTGVHFPQSINSIDAIKHPET